MAPIEDMFGNLYRLVSVSCQSLAAHIAYWNSLHVTRRQSSGMELRGVCGDSEDSRIRFPSLFADGVDDSCLLSTVRSHAWHIDDTMHSTYPCTRGTVPRQQTHTPISSPHGQSSSFPVASRSRNKRSDCRILEGVGLIVKSHLFLKMHPGLQAKRIGNGRSRASEVIRSVAMKEAKIV